MIVLRILLKYLRKIKDPRVVTIVLVLVICSQIIMVGKRLGIEGAARTWFIVGTLVIGIAVIIFLQIRENKKKKEAEAAERSLLLEADSLVMSSSGAQRRANERAREELVEAIEALKKTASAQGRSGKSALRDLPWFLVLGNDETGKSTMIRNSGLSFPGSRPGELRTRRKGVGPGRSAEWWFTNNAVLIEVNGRFVLTEDDEMIRHDWVGVLETLRKARQAIPINGIVVALSMNDVIKQDSAKLDETARVLRQRLDTAVTTLRAFCPVYLVVTKADLVHGFEEFFDDLEGNARDQVLGATFSHDQMDEGEPTRVFAEEFEVLYRSLCKRRIPRMAAEERPERRGPLYLFPLEFLSLRRKLHRFVRTLCEPNPYGESPMFRGFYFTSGSVEGQPVEMVVNEVSRVIGLPPDMDASDMTRVIDQLPEMEEPATSSQATRSSGSEEARFLRELFTRILMRDRSMARPTEKAAQRRKVQKYGGAIAGLVVVALVAIFMVISFARNRSLINTTVELARDAALIPAGADGAAEIESRLNGLEAFRGWLVGLDDKDESVPFTMGFGLYRGREVNIQARNVYFDRLAAVLLGPSRREMERDLLLTYPRSPEEYEKWIDGYRAYLMMIEPPRAEPQFLAEQLVRLWAASGRAAGTGEGLRDAIRRHVSYAWRHPGDVTYHSADLPGRNEALANRAAVYIREYWRPDNYYQAMIERVNGAVPAFTIASVPAGSQLLATDADLVAEDPTVAFVPGSYTLKGWWDEIRDRIENSEEQLRSDWFYRQAFEGQTLDMRDWLMETYQKDYVAHWTRFLAAVDVSPVNGVGQSAQRLRELSGPGSPFIRLLEDASSNLRFRSEAAGPDGEAPLSRVEDDFAALHALFVVQDQSDQAIRPLDQVISNLAALVEELRGMQEKGDVGFDATAYAKNLLGGATGPSPLPESVRFAERHCSDVLGGNSDCTSALLTYLRRPAESAWGAILLDAQSYLDAAWDLNVYEQFNETLTGKYPFQPGGPDAAFEEFNRFFAPGGVFWTFHDNELKPFLDHAGEPRLLYGHALEIGPKTTTAIRKASDIQRALYSSASGSLEFSFRITPAQTKKISGAAPFARTTHLTVGETRVVYDMGLRRESTVSWPGENAVGGARVGATMDGPDPDGKSYDGPWAFFRLLEDATVSGITDTQYDIRWTLRHDDYAIEVPYDVRTTSSRNPFPPGFLRFECPRQVGPGPGGPALP